METKSCPACLQSIDVRALRCSHCASRQPDAPMMHRDLPGRVAGGVCAALSLQLGWDPILVRVLFVAGLAVTGGLTFWAYALLWLLTPFEVRGQAPLNRLLDAISGLFNKTTGPSTSA